MIDPELRAVVERLSKAGTEFECVCVDKRGRPLPPGSPVWEMEPEAWDAVWVPEWTILGSDHPEATFVQEQMDRFHGSPDYAARLSDTAAEIQVAYHEEIDAREQRDWDVPGGLG